MIDFFFFLGSAKMPSGQVQSEGVLHTCWLLLGCTKSLPANATPLSSGCYETVSLCSTAPGIYNIT